MCACVLFPQVVTSSCEQLFLPQPALMASFLWCISAFGFLCRSTAQDPVFLQIWSQNEQRQGLPSLASPPSAPKMEGKYQVLIPKPTRHASGADVFHLTQQILEALKEAAKAAGGETWKIVNAQFFSRLSSLPSLESSSVERSDFRVDFLHQIDEPTATSLREHPRDRTEAYSLNVTQHDILIAARSSWALANAMATLYQLVSVQVTDGAHVSMSIPGCPHYIEDQPGFVHRGVLLDVSRQWYSVPWIKVLIAALSEFKINVLHLHLTDTASWPVEIEGYPEMTQALSYRDINGNPLTYSRSDIREMVEFARVRGVSILPEIDGPMHAPALAAALNLTVAATVNFSLPQFAYEPPPGTWNISSLRAMQFVRTALEQAEEDFFTAPFLHVGGDEPTAASLCVLLDEPLREFCWEQCTSTSVKGCGAVPKKPKEAKSGVTWWFPEYLNAKVQDYFDSVTPSPAKIPRAIWSGAVTDMGVEVPPTDLKHKSALQLWTFPSSSSTSQSISEADCQKYDLIQSAATYPQDGSTYGWLYMDCGSGANWIDMGPNYWCPRASWAALYSLNATQGYGDGLTTSRCQEAFLGAEMALWSEVGGMGNGMALIFPRAAAFAERMWSNPPALTAEQMTGGQPPESYWQSHLRDAMARLNQVVANFELLHLGVSHLQPEFCRVHPEYCNTYTKGFYEESEA
ncbi:Chitooligosaccharidolytic beta-N-acetylglucosaminidase (Beta-GlcNAcase) (Beta-N-acetylhexosaminidase) (Beta-hexosaminidase) [Durusdinium trenchii]|uniref:Beta-hexosaminidase n=1 Tax=Durusdinium trenchii TaxID=1381693 RepID=A0ABP0IYD4_9DINO